MNANELPAGKYLIKRPSWPIAKLHVKDENGDWFYGESMAKLPCLQPDMEITPIVVLNAKAKK